jgi:hypothetical protein
MVWNATIFWKLICEVTLRSLPGCPMNYALWVATLHLVFDWVRPPKRWLQTKLISTCILLTFPVQNIAELRKDGLTITHSKKNNFPTNNSNDKQGFTQSTPCLWIATLCAGRFVCHWPLIGKLQIPGWVLVTRRVMDQLIRIFSD